MNWGIEVTKRNPLTGKPVHRPNGSLEKIKILIQDTRFKNGERQSLYFQMDHPNKNLQGKFKGMAVILQERGFGDMSNVRAECKGFDANLEKPNAAVNEFSTTKKTSPMWNHCSRQIVLGVEFTLFSCRNSIAS